MMKIFYGIFNWILLWIPITMVATRISPHIWVFSARRKSLFIEATGLSIRELGDSITNLTFENYIFIDMVFGNDSLILHCWPPFKNVLLAVNAHQDDSIDLIANKFIDLLKQTMVKNGDGSDGAD